MIGDAHALLYRTSQKILSPLRERIRGLFGHPASLVHLDESLNPQSTEGSVDGFLVDQAVLVDPCIFNAFGDCGRLEFPSSP